MAEFTEVIKQAQLICKKFHNSERGCFGCPLVCKENNPDWMGMYYYPCLLDYVTTHLGTAPVVKVAKQIEKIALNPDDYEIELNMWDKVTKDISVRSLKTCDI